MTYANTQEAERLERQLTYLLGAIGADSDCYNLADLNFAAKVVSDGLTDETIGRFPHVGAVKALRSIREDADALSNSLTEIIEALINAE